MDNQKIWIDDATGYRCSAYFDRHWCGYVEVPDDHPWYGKGYNQCTKSIDPCKDTYCEHCPESLIEVHGGITFAGSLVIKGSHAFGFDCGHGGDNLWTCHLDYVIAETTSLAKQLHAFAQEQPHADH